MFLMISSTWNSWSWLLTTVVVWQFHLVCVFSWSRYSTINTVPWNTCAYIIIQNFPFFFFFFFSCLLLREKLQRHAKASKLRWSPPHYPQGKFALQSDNQEGPPPKYISTTSEMSPCRKRYTVCIRDANVYRYGALALEGNERGVRRERKKNMGDIFLLLESATMWEGRRCDHLWIRQDNNLPNGMRWLDRYV